MLYNTANFWRSNDGLIWHSFSRHVPGGGTTDLTMGPVSSYHDKELQTKAYEKTLAWARSHRMNITDSVGA